MATYYVGSGGNDASDGLSWANRKLTLNGAENIPVAAGDVVYVAPGVYREMLTCDVSGSAGSPITYIGDYDGSHTDGVGGVVRITGSDNDQTVTRASCVTDGGTQRDYRTFRGFLMDTVSATLIHGQAAGTGWTIDSCYLDGTLTSITALNIVGANQAAWTVKNCYMQNAWASGYGIAYNHSATVDNTGHVVENCIIANGVSGINNNRIGGITIRNSLIYGGRSYGIRINAALAAGQTMTINNCFVGLTNGALSAVNADSTFVEDCNNLFGNNADRTNVNVGANSKTYPPLFDSRWFFELVGGGSIVTPFDLSAWSQLINVAGTSPTTADMRGTTVQGAEREWGALEYDSTLDIEAGATGGGVNMPRVRVGH